LRLRRSYSIIEEESQPIVKKRRATSIHLHVVPSGYCRLNPVAKTYSAA